MELESPPFRRPMIQVLQDVSVNRNRIGQKKYEVHIDDAMSRIEYTRLESNDTMYLNHTMEHMSTRLPFGGVQASRSDLGWGSVGIEDRMCEGSHWSPIKSPRDIFWGFDLGAVKVESKQILRACYKR